ncbi:MAG TPA: acyl-CoA dehydrogenase [Jatrophihabitans sp.]|nr:acyl-CoA dehydrogenase [Jatrophihabitans sp.]
MPDSRILSRRDVEFLLFEWLEVPELLQRPRFAEHGPDTVRAVLELAEQLAQNDFAPHNRRADEHEPHVVDGKVVLIDEVAPALRKLAESGLMASTFDAELGGMQLPVTVARAAMAWLQAANVATSAYPFLTMANAALLVAHGSPEQVETWVRPMLGGRYFGTMCLSEPQAGSSLADITTRAEPQPDGSYLLFGNKMWISGGDHELAENIVHLVLAKVPGGPPGVKGISLFIVPKLLADGQRNDVTLAGLNHKMGYRGTTNCLLNLGENGGAVGYLVGELNSGLAAMFHMMNEARIGVGLGATALGYTGYLHALDYARNRLQGRPATNRDASQPQRPIIEHPDVRRMLLAQKSYVEGGLALGLYCSKLVDLESTATSDAERARAHQLLDVLTPIAKAWPSQWCLAANDLAIQVHGGYGYARDYPVEQFYRDNRLNPIHEGTNGIQALDLLGRKVAQDGGAGLRLLAETITGTLDRAASAAPAAREFAASVHAALQRLLEVTATLYGTGDPELTLANAHVYLEASGHLVVGWLWLDQLLAVGDQPGPFYEGKRRAARYFHRWELPRTGPMFDLLESLDRAVLDTPPDVL